MKANKTLPLFPEVLKKPVSPISPVPATPPREKTVKPRDLWLCIVLDQLPLDIFPKHCIEDKPYGISEEQHGGQRLVACNDVAKKLGVRNGLPLNAALALVPDLEVITRSPEKEQQTLERLGAWACQFTSHVSVGDGHFLWLEVGRSIRLFGGVAPLRQRIKQSIAKLGISARLSIAPTPMASLWLARAGCDVIIREYHELPGQLGKLPLTTASWANDTQIRLQRMGVNTLGEFLRLPRSGIARRFGQDCLQQLDRALGRTPDPKPSFQIQPHYEGYLDLPCEMSDQGLLAHGVKRLVEELGGFLLARQSGIQHLTVKFFHLEQPATVVNLGLLSLSRDPKQLMSLLSERMERTSFPEPVIGISLNSGKVRRLDPSNDSLLAGKSLSDFSPELIDRLRARLGVDSVYGIDLVSEHRPERAWTLVEPGTCSRFQKAASNRPLWLLQDPVNLEVYKKQPYFDGALRLVSKPERIETGWWDNADICRDYYVASNPEGKKLWIYRDRRRRGQWFLHGIFG